jgi:hypothetical protein
LNSGDWIENLTALEYQNKKWRLYHHKTESATFDHEEENFEYETQLLHQFISIIDK